MLEKLLFLWYQRQNKGLFLPCLFISTIEELAELRIITILAENWICVIKVRNDNSLFSLEFFLVNDKVDHSSERLIHDWGVESSLISCLFLKIDYRFVSVQEGVSVFLTEIV